MPQPFAHSRFRTALLWSVFAASSSSLSYGQSTIGILFHFDHKPSPTVFAAMRDETARLLAPAGFSTIFHDSLTGTRQVFDTAFSVRLKGACHTSSVLRPSSNNGGILDPFAPSTVRLAATRTQGSTVLPIAEVECDNIIGALQSIPPKNRSRIFGYALGRIIAHELYHLLLQSTKHSHSGLAKAVVSWSELLSDSMQFSLGDVHRLLHTGK